MEDVDLGNSEGVDEGEGLITGSMLTITSSEFHRMSNELREEAEEEGENELIGVEPDLSSQQGSVNLSLEDSKSTTRTAVNLQNSPGSQKTLGSSIKTFQPTPFDDSFSNETLIGPLNAPIKLPEPESVLDEKGDTSTERSKVISSRRLPPQPNPIFYMNLTRIKREEKFDAFSEDEEPVLRTSYTLPQTPKEPEPKLEVRQETIMIYNVRTGIPPSPKSKPEKYMEQHGSFSSPALTSRASRASIVKKNSRLLSSGSRLINWKNQDLTPHQRDLRNVSFEELSSTEVAIIKGLWKCIAFNLWTFGALTTINFFRIRGHIAFNDQKATPEEMMKCRFLWPHANQSMKALEAVVLNLHTPEESHRLVYELGKKHGKLKIPLSEIQSEMVINSFLYTFYQHVHPKMTMKELNILRKFSKITMFLFMDASRWDSEPLPLY